MGENENTRFVEKRQNRIDPQEYVYQGYQCPLSTFYKNSKNIERNLFLRAKMKTRALSKNGKIDPMEYVYQGFPPSTIDILVFMAL